MDDAQLTGLAERLVAVDGVVAVVLGGSRARGAHRPDSDIDLGLYYRDGLDVCQLRELAATVSGQPVEITCPGGWGRWVNGGGWLTIDGWRVDWIYRDLDRVRQVWADCCQGRYEVGAQPGHPLGFYSHAYAGEVAMCRVLADPSRQLTDLQAQTQVYPPALAEALVAGLWEAEFAVGLARYGAAAADPTYAAGCLFRAVGVACHALHGHGREWLINEKGMVASAGRLAAAPPRFAERAHAMLAAVGHSAEQISQTASDAAALVEQVRSATTADPVQGSTGTATIEST
jgi:predicted nucleotidyltransferase